MSLHNADAKLSVAADMLASAHTPLRDCLFSAWTQGLSRVDPNDLPSEIRAEFEQLVAAMTSKPPALPGEGSVQATLRDMDDAKLDNTARRIRGLAHAVELEVARQESLRPKR